MARQVYFDPFGSYVRGFDTGAQRQMNMEDAVRRDRARDYDFNVLQPYRTAAIERNDTLESHALPYKIHMLPIGYQNAVNNLYGNQFDQGVKLAQITGITQPLLNDIGRHYGLRFGTAGNGTTIAMRGPDGQLYPIQRQPDFRQHVLDNINWDRILAASNANNMNAYRVGSLQNISGRISAYELGQQAQLMRALNALNGGSGAFNGTTLSGFSMPDISEFNVPAQ